MLRILRDVGEGRLVLAGELDVAGAVEVLAAVAAHSSATTVDVSRVTFVDAAGFGTLLRLLSASPDRAMELGASSAAVIRLTSIVEGVGPREA